MRARIHQVVINADTRLVVLVGRPLAGNRNDCLAWEESGAKAAAGNATVIADGGYQGTGLIIPHHRQASPSLSKATGTAEPSHTEIIYGTTSRWDMGQGCRVRSAHRQGTTWSRGVSTGRRQNSDS